MTNLFPRASLVGFFLLLSFFSSGSFAETPISPSPAEAAATAAIALEDPESKAAVRELVSTLNDDAVRALLIQRLDAVAEAKEQQAANSTGSLGVLEQGLTSYAQYAKNAFTNIPRLSEPLAKAFSSLKNALAPNHSPGSLFIYLLFALAIGLIAERVVAFFFRKRKQRLIEEFSTKLFGILRIIYTRLSMDILGVLAFTTASYLFLRSYFPADSLPMLFTYSIIGGLMAAGMGYVVGRFFFAPKKPEIRICGTTDERAMRLTVSYALLAGYIVFIHGFFHFLFEIGIREYGGYEYMSHLGYFFNISMYALAIATIWYNKDGLREVLLENRKRVTAAIGEENTVETSWFAEHWPQIATLLLVLKYFLVEIIINTTDVGTYSVAAVYTTFIVIFLWPGIDANISLFAWKSVPIPEDETPAAAKARRSMQQGLLRIGRVLVICIVLFAQAKLWGLQILDLAEAGLGAQVAGGILEMLLVFLFAYICWELVSIVIDYWLAQEGGAAADQEEADGGGEIGGVGLSRVATILPIIQKTAKFLIVVVAIIMILDNWGVNIGPILAGAGVIGLAIGFGAQTLVKDIVSGMFFLADDAFRVGEYISVDGTMGNVEKISIRSLRLRHHRGLVHTIPYGEIPKLTNYSRDWVIMKLRFKVPFETDVNKVKKIFKQIGRDLLEHPELGPDFLQPFKSQGVAEVDDNGLVVRGKFMAKPGKQFTIRKEVYVRVQKALEEAGIPFARKQVMVHIPGLDKDQKLDEEDLRSIGAAAAEAADEQDEPNTDKSKKPVE